MDKKTIIVENKDGILSLSLDGIEESELLQPGYSVDDLAKKVATLLTETNDKKSNLQIDIKQGFVKRDNVEIPLIAKEIMLLKYFYEHSHEIVTRDQLFAAVWGAKYDDYDSRTLDVHISRLRKKLGDIDEAQVCIQTVRGIGYKFIAP